MAGWITEEKIIETEPRDYPVLYREIGSVLPHLNELDKRKILAIVVCTCPHCKETGTNCYCMRDD